MQFSSLFLAALAGVAQAVDIQVVSVGKSATNQTGLKFWPSNVKAAVGTMVQFQFWVGNHTVTQSNFDNPCIPINNINSSIEGFYSGYMPVEASADKSMIPTYTITIKDEKPIWIFCSQGKHCQAGMSMVINENTSANSSRSLENYQTLAKSAEGSNLVPGDSNSGNNGGDNNSGNDNSSGGSTSGSDNSIPTATTVDSGSTTPTGTGSSSTETAIVAGSSRMSAPVTSLFALVAFFALL